ncbi:STAS domain-containing protein [Streptomyces mirabilis]|uniref:STAS domain-containing protein n=1 Tax=Streptomyces mirabilis TaxID=68239 RepID=UPI00368302CE
MDLSGVPFANSPVLHALVHGQHKHAAIGVQPVLAGANMMMRRIFEVTRHA